jgi:Domain of unknown function (DUF4350)
VTGAAPVPAAPAPSHTPADPSTAGFPGTSGTQGASGGNRRARLRRWIWPLAIAGVVVLTALISALLVPTTDRGALDPRSAAPTGSRAVAQVLRAHGVPVDLEERSADAVQGAGTGDTIVVVAPELLGPVQLQRLHDTTANLVLVEPDLTVLQSLAPGIVPAGSALPRTAEPGCPDQDALAAGTTTAGGSLYRLDGPPTGSQGDTSTGLIGCYPDTQNANSYSFVRLHSASHQVIILGQSQVLENGTLADEGNAALALRTLGARQALRWYFPDPMELGTTGAPTLSELVPGPARWIFVELLLATVVALVWRARRLGRVVIEPLPVVVRSAETVEGRARLYRTSHSRDRAAAILRTAALRRLAHRLGVPAGAPPEEVVRLVAAASGRDERVVGTWLLGSDPRDDAGLLALATTLDEIERSITDAPGGYGGPRFDVSHPAGDGVQSGEGGRP